MMARPCGWDRLGPHFCSFDDRIGLYDEEAADTVGRWLHHASAPDIWALSGADFASLQMALADLDIEGLSESLVSALMEEHLAQYEQLRLGGPHETVAALPPPVAGWADEPHAAIRQSSGSAPSPQLEESSPAAVREGFTCSLSQVKKRQHKADELIEVMDLNGVEEAEREAEAERAARDAFAAYEALPRAGKRAAHAEHAVGLDVAKGMVAHHRSWRHVRTLDDARLAEVLAGLAQADGGGGAPPLDLFALTLEEEEEERQRTRERILGYIFAGATSP